MPCHFYQILALNCRCPADCWIPRQSCTALTHGMDNISGLRQVIHILSTFSLFTDFRISSEIRRSIGIPPLIDIVGDAMQTYATLYRHAKSLTFRLNMTVWFSALRFGSHLGVCPVSLFCLVTCLIRLSYQSYLPTRGNYCDMQVSFVLFTLRSLSYSFFFLASATFGGHAEDNGDVFCYEFAWPQRDLILDSEVRSPHNTANALMVFRDNERRSSFCQIHLTSCYELTLMLFPVRTCRRFGHNSSAAGIFSLSSTWIDLIRARFDREILYCKWRKIRSKLVYTFIFLANSPALISTTKRHEDGFLW